MKLIVRITKSLIIIMAVLMFQGCVAKKKFVAMEDSRNRAEDRVIELTNKVELIENEFEGYKNDFHFNNAQKNLQIDSLSKGIMYLENNLMSKDESLDDQLMAFQVEKRRLNQMLVVKDRELNDVKRKLSTAETRVADLQSEIQSRQAQLRNASAEQNALQSQVNQKEREVEKLKTDYNNLVSEINTLRHHVAEKDDKIEVLQNQVKLLRSQLGID